MLVAGPADEIGPSQVMMSTGWPGDWRAASVGAGVEEVPAPWSGGSFWRGAQEVPQFGHLHVDIDATIFLSRSAVTASGFVGRHGRRRRSARPSRPVAGLDHSLACLVEIGKWKFLRARSRCSSGCRRDPVGRSIRRQYFGIAKAAAMSRAGHDIYRPAGAPSPFLKAAGCVSPKHEPRSRSATPRRRRCGVVSPRGRQRRRARGGSRQNRPRACVLKRADRHVGAGMMTNSTRSTLASLPPGEAARLLAARNERVLLVDDLAPAVTQH